MKTIPLLMLSVLSLLATDNFHKTIHPEKAAVNTGINCGPFNNNGIQQCVVGIQTDILNVRGLDTQDMDQWCWAASIQAVFHYYGHVISQQRIVAETFGTVVNMPGQPDDILRALNRTWTDDDGRTFGVQANSYSANLSTAMQDLSTDNPLIIGTLGHAMVLTAIHYNHDIYNNFSVTAAVVRDPWPANARRRVLSAQEWYSTQFLARIRVY